MLLDRQIDAYVAADLPRLADLSEGAFRGLFDPLRERASGLSQQANPADGALPYVAEPGSPLHAEATSPVGTTLRGATGRRQ